jgi:hypothetical protein
MLSPQVFARDCIALLTRVRAASRKALSPKHTVDA